MDRDEQAEEDRRFLEALGRRLRRRRRELVQGNNVVDLAEASGVSHSYISRLERGLIPRPTWAELRGVARGYGFRSLCEMLEGMDSPGDDAMMRALTQHGELVGRFAAIAGGWGWASPEVRALVIATLDALGGQLSAGRQEGVQTDQPGE